MAPNHFGIVEAVAAGRNWQMHTHDGLAQFTEAVVQALHKHDPKWGHLKKNPGQTQINGRAEDSALYLEDTGLSQSVDFVAGANTSGAKPAWQPDTPRYTKADWIDPDGGTYIPVPFGGPQPIPPVLVKPCPDPKAHEPKPPIPYPGDRVWDVIGERLLLDMQKAGQDRLNPQSGTWIGRTIWRVVNEGMTLEASIAQSEKEWRVVLGLEGR